MGGVGLAVLCIALVLAPSPSRAVLVAGAVFVWLFAVTRGAA